MQTTAADEATVVWQHPAILSHWSQYHVRLTEEALASQHIQVTQQLSQTEAGLQWAVPARLQPDRVLSFDDVAPATSSTSLMPVFLQVIFPVFRPGPLYSVFNSNR